MVPTELVCNLEEATAASIQEIRMEFAYQRLVDEFRFYMSRCDQDEFDAINIDFDSFCKQLFKDIKGD